MFHYMLSRGSQMSRSRFIGMLLLIRKKNYLGIGLDKYVKTLYKPYPQNNNSASMKSKLARRDLCCGLPSNYTLFPISELRVHLFHLQCLLFFICISSSAHEYPHCSLPCISNSSPNQKRSKINQCCWRLHSREFSLEEINPSLS